MAVLRDSGLVLRAEGKDGWQQVLTEDRMAPGHYEAIGIIDDWGRQILVTLAPNEKPYAARRHYRKIGMEGPAKAACTVIGIEREDGLSSYLFVSDEGVIGLSSSLNAF